MKWSSKAVGAAVLDKQRNSVWNDDQFERVMASAGAGEGSRILDVGAGSGGMLELFAEVLGHNSGATLTCVEREPSLIAAIVDKAAGLGIRVTALAGDATKLELQDASFDIAFCQTLLMHVARPELVIAELRRVVRPGGSVVIVEGNAVISTANRPTDAAPQLLRLWHLIRIGRRALGRGDIAIGDEVPALLAAAGIELVDARIVDRMLAGERGRQQYAALLERSRPVMEQWRAGFGEAFCAAGGTASEFDELWQLHCRVQAEQLDHAGTWCGVLAGLLYVFTGRVPE